MQYPRLVESKTAAHEVKTVCWNPGMDLLATVFENGALTCSRLLSLQKVWHRAPSGKIISIAWRPDGRVLAIGTFNEMTKKNVCSLHDVEDGKEINYIEKDSVITSVAWFNCCPIDKHHEQEDPLRGKKVPETPEVKTDTFSHQLAHKQTQLNIMIISTNDGKISLYALGLFHLSDIQIHDEPNSMILQTHMSSCMRYIKSLVSIQSSSNISHSSLRLMRLATLQSRSQEILNVAKMYGKITDELEYLDDTLGAITTSWTDVLAGLDNKLSSYCSRRGKKPDDSTGGNYTFLGADDLLQLLVLGYSSDNLEKFLTDMSDKGLRKLNNAIEQTCLRVQNLIVKNAQKCCYHIHNDLNLLRGMSLWRDRYADIGLDDKPIVEAMRDVGSLILKLTELQQVIDHSLKSTKSFFRWLISIACRMSGEHSTSVPSDVNKTTQQDIQLITDFILENFDYNANFDEFLSSIGWTDDDISSEDSDNWKSRPTCSNFTLEYVGQYLKNESLTRLKYSFTKPGSNFWIDFFESRPDISVPKILEEDGSSMLLFYPHRPNTSLIQEHKQACNSIEGAFKSVASHINLVPKDGGTNFVNLKDFTRNEQLRKIRLETDIRTMNHYTILQTKDSPVTKQYLVSQSLDDKSFRLISVEFQSINPATATTRQTTSTRLSSGLSGTILISDSSFYDNKDMKKLLVTFLLIDQPNNDTILVQVEIEKLFLGSGCPERSQKDLPRVFRNNETIEKHSSQLILKLDLQSEPPGDRKHEPEMMVKRIKGVAGLDMYASSSRGVIAYTSTANKRLHLYELESDVTASDMVDDDDDGGDEVDENMIDTDLLG